MTGIRGHFNGTNIVLDENFELAEGQEVFVVVGNEPSEPLSGLPKKKVDLSQFIIPFERGENGEHIDAVEYIRGLRDNDRF